MSEWKRIGLGYEPNSRAVFSTVPTALSELWNTHTTTLFKTIVLHCKQIKVKETLQREVQFAEQLTI